MEVKIYREPENEALIINEEQLNEYKTLISKLDLKSEIKQTVPSVYVPINDAMSKLLKALCPAETNVKEYKKSTIPLEVLKVLDFAQSNEMYEGYLIWHADKDPDPLLIGWNYSNDEAREKKYSWQKDYFLMARWGDCSLELEELLKKGFESLKISLIDSAKEVLNVSKNILDDPDSYVRKHLKSSFNFPRIEINGSSNLGDLPF